MRIRCWGCGEIEEVIVIYDAFYCAECAVLFLLERIEKLEEELERLKRLERELEKEA